MSQNIRESLFLFHLFLRVVYYLCRSVILAELPKIDAVKEIIESSPEEMKNKNVVASLPIKVSSDKKLNYQDNKNILPTGGRVTYEDFIFLSTAGRELFEITPEVNIYKFVAEWINKLMKNSLVFVSSCNEAQSILSISAAAGVGRDFEKIIAILGRNPIGLSFSLNAEARKCLASGRLEKVDGGIYELSCHKVPRIVCEGLEGVLNIRSTYAKGLTWLGKIMGGVSILMRYENEIKNPNIIATFLDYSAVVLHRRLQWQV